MSKGTKGGSVYVEISLDKEQFDKDLKAAGREIVAAQRQLSMEMQRNKIKFQLEGLDKNWAERLVGSSVIGKIQSAGKETAFLNEQIRYQQNKVDLASAAWKGLVERKGAMAGATLAAEGGFLREQAALVRLKEQLEGTTSASSVMGGALKSAALAGAAAVTALAASYATAVKSAVEWGQAVNDISDETGMADAESAKLLGTMMVVGISAEDAAGSLAKLAKTVSAASTAQVTAARTGKDADDVFSKYGITIRGAEGNLLSYSEILANITEKHRSMNDGMEKTAMEMAIFGKAGYKLNDLLNMTSERSSTLRQDIEALGLATGVNSQKAEDFNQQLARMKLAFTSIANTITGDDIAALSSLIEKLIELAKWIRGNKDAITEVKSDLGKSVDATVGPIIKGFEMAGAAVKKYIEWRQKSITDSKGPASADTSGDVARAEAAAKAADEERKRNNEAVLAKLKNDIELRKSAQELQTAVLSLQGYTLSAQLANIEVERKAWAEKTKDEVAATEWAEAAKQKAYKESQDRMQAALDGIKSAFQGAYGTAISKVEEAIKTGSSSAWKAADDAIKQMKEDLKTKTEASRAVARAAGFSEQSIQSGMYDPQTPQEQIAKAFNSLEEATKAGSEAVRKEIEGLRKDLSSQGKGGSSGGGDPKKSNNPARTTTDDIFSREYNDQQFAKRIEGMSFEEQLYEISVRQNQLAGVKVESFQKSSEEVAASIERAKAVERQYQIDFAKENEKYYPKAQAGNVTINTPVTVNVNGMDAYSAEQLGQIAAQRIIPKIEQAINQTQTSYGGKP